MDSFIDTHDVQGNIVRAYGRWGFPKARYICFRVVNGAAARNTLRCLTPLITTGGPWTTDGTSTTKKEKPTATVNIALTYEGLKHLGVPEASLHSFPDAFSMGMKARREILGDIGSSAPAKWDPVWGGDETEQPVHVMIWINGRDVPATDESYDKIRKVIAQIPDGLEQLSGHRNSDTDQHAYQEASAVYIDGKPSAKEHFGYTDGISEPYFIGSEANPQKVIGGGKRTTGDVRTAAGWEPLATGEFILGYKDEAFEYPKAAMPPLLSKNGTFMVYRKLHENVGAFEQYMNTNGEQFGGRELLAAKFAGRWANGAPLTTFPTKESADKFAAELLTTGDRVRAGTATSAEKTRYRELQLQLRAFDFNDDLDGAKCPIGSHIRRINPRGALEFGQKGAFETPGALVNRRRILRRGLPYGEVKDKNSDDGDHGVIFIVLNASIRRQFEFVQQQWINYSNDFKLANDKDPLLGSHGVSPNGTGTGNMTLEADTKGSKPPSFCRDIPRFVDCRGGDYFFVPSLTALRMIASGVIDPT